MKNNLIKDINNYINYLNSKGLYVSVHGKTISGLIENNIHKNSYCSFIKTRSEAWNRCIKCQKNVLMAYNNDYLFGMCHAGVEEYVFFVDDKTFISISGYGIDKEKAAERINRLSYECHFDKSELLTVYERALMHKKENISDLKILVKPLCHMLFLLQIMSGDIQAMETKSKLFDSILAFVQNNIMQDITIRSIADACVCSESTVSHLFKEYTNQSVKKYINNLRIKQAERLLLTTNLPIGNVAALSGFADTNYFSTAFKKNVGLSPAKFREENNL